MDLYNLSLSLPLPNLPSEEYLFHLDNSTDSYDKLSAAITQSQSCVLNHRQQPHNSIWHLSGSFQNVLNARGQLIRDYPIKSFLRLKIPKADLLSHDLSSTNPLDSICPPVKDKIVELNAQMGVNFAVKELPPSNFQHGLQLQQMVQLTIVGGQEAIEHAKIDVLVAIDQANGLHADKVDIDFKLHPIIASKKRTVIRTIEEETETNVYLPPPLAGVLGNSSPRAGSQPDQRNMIHITGDFFGVQRAKDMLVQVAVQKVNSKSVLSRDAALLPRKLDALVLERADELRTIMADNGTFIKFPIIGSQASIIQIFGDNRVSIERTIRSVMQLACYYYVASVWLLPVTFDVLIPPPSINPSTVPPGDLERLASETGAEIVLKSNCFEAHGTDASVRDAIIRILDLDIVQGFHHEIRFQVELANEHRDFISGKKNGKINKIMKSANVRIKYETLSEYNFLIDVAGSDLGALSGLSMLQEELPAEMSFHVPEVYHKRIIGVGGKNIQRIMKKFGVYVKFSNADEFAALGGYCDNEDNVISRTPAKNAMNLENLKQSVMELVNPKDKDYTNESILIPRKYHRTLLGEKSIFLHDIESKTGCIVRFPDKELATDSVAIFGPEHQVNVAKTMVLDHVPFEAQYLAPRSAQVKTAVEDTKFVELINSLRSDLHVSISAPSPLSKPSDNGQVSSPQSASSSASEEEDDVAFQVRCQRSNIDMLGAAKDALEDYLKSHSVPLHARPNIPAQQSMRPDVLVGAFPLFNSKIIQATESPTKESFDGFQDASAQFARPGDSRNNILSSNSIGNGSSAASLMSQKPGFSGSSTLGGTKTGAVGSSRRLRAAVSTPNVKALFGSDGSGGYPGSTVSSPDSNTALSSPYGGIGEEAVNAAPTQAQLQQAQAAAAYYAAASQQAQEQHYTQSVWGPPTPPTQYGRAAVPSAADATKSYAQTTEDAAKRGSDSVLEAKLKREPQRTLASQRAQSLDLGALVGKTQNATGNNAQNQAYAGVVGDPSAGAGASAGNYPASANPSSRPSPREYNKPQRPSHLGHQSHYSIGGPIGGVMQQDPTFYGSSASLGGHAHTRSMPQVTPPEIDSTLNQQFYSPLSPPLSASSNQPIGSSASVYAQQNQPSQPTGLRHTRSVSTNPRNSLQNIPNPISIPPTNSTDIQYTNMSNPNSATSATFSQQQIPSRIATPSSNFDGLSSDQANEISRVLAQFTRVVVSFVDRGEFSSRFSKVENAKILDQIAYRCCVRSILNQTSELGEIVVKLAQYSALSFGFSGWLKDWLNRDDSSLHAQEDFRERQVREFISCQSDTMIFQYVKGYHKAGFKPITNSDFKSITLPPSTPDSQVVETSQRESAKFHTNLRKADFLGPPLEWKKWDISEHHLTYHGFGKAQSSTNEDEDEAEAEASKENASDDYASLIQSIQTVCSMDRVNKKDPLKVMNLLHDVQTNEKKYANLLKDMDEKKLRESLSGKNLCQQSVDKMIEMLTDNFIIKTQEDLKAEAKARKRRQKKAKKKARKSDPETVVADDEVYIEPHIEIKMDSGITTIKKAVCFTKSLSSLHKDGVSFNYQDFDKPIAERLHIAEQLINGQLSVDEYLSNHIVDSQGDKVHDIYVYLKVFERRPDGNYPKVDGLVSITDFHDEHCKECCYHTEGSECLMRLVNQPGLLLVMKAANDDVLTKWRAIEDANDAVEYPSSSEASDYSLSQLIPELLPLSAEETKDDKKVEEKKANCHELVLSYVEYNSRTKHLESDEEDRTLRHKPSIDIYAEGIWYAYTRHAFDYSISDYEKFMEQTTTPEPSLHECKFKPKTRSQTKRLVKQFVEQQQTN
ncbi:hypothetical protein E3P99_01093 [Wallemia hederae]|uniref:K Homology domain-containing protein n=1 Tax=Wallemia hederae TaxID=1540922 RepID=A0A4T0FSF4_9BASI|nr:hypothetical protein E3P99_01093 [Wallemia hederae]